MSGGSIRTAVLAWDISSGSDFKSHEQLHEPLAISDKPIIQDSIDQRKILIRCAIGMIIVPVAFQASWVHIHPISACFFTCLILTIGLHLAINKTGLTSEIGCLLVGLSGSWLAGSVYWGWMREMPIWHLPIEAMAMPIALFNLKNRWQIASSFYLASLAGTALTDCMIVLTGVMNRWPDIVKAELEEAGPMLHQTALDLIHPLPLISLCIAAILVAIIARKMNSISLSQPQSSHSWAIASAVLKTTVLVDGLFLICSLFQPGLSGLV